MKTFIAVLVAGLFSLSAHADIPVKNAEYAAQAKVAAKEIYDLNWGPSNASQFEVIAEEYLEDDVSVEGTYKVRVFIEENGERSDSGIDLNVYIYGNAVLEVKVDCRSCG